jgi:hypothetical protein
MADPQLDIQIRPWASRTPTFDPGSPFQVEGVPQGPSDFAAPTATVAPNPGPASPGQAIVSPNQAPAQTAPQFDPSADFSVESQAPQVTTSEAAMRGAASGLTAGFHDELAGLSDASGFGNLPLYAGGFAAPVVGAARIGIEHILGGDEAQKAYQAGRDRMRALQAAAQEQHPIAYGAGAVGGAVAGLPFMPEATIAKGGGLVARTLNMGATGGLYGALFGAGAGEGTQDTVNQATNGALIGAAGGAVASPVVAAIGKGASAVTAPIRKALNPDKEAARRVFSGIALDRPGTTPHDVANAIMATHQAGEPVIVADLGKGRTQALARSAANSSRNTTLADASSKRFQDQGQRFRDDIVHIVGGNPESVGAKESIKEAAQRANDKRYAPLMAAHPVVNVPAAITERPAVAQAMKDAVSLAKNRGEKIINDAETKTILAGDGYHIAEDVTSPAKKSLRYWDYVKKALDTRINGMMRKGGIEELDSKEKADLQGLLEAKKALVAHLDSVAPGYAEARAGAARFFGAEDAMTAGENFVNSRLSNEEAKRAIAKMTPEERKAFAYGFASELLKTIREIPLKDRSTIASKAFLNSPAAKERISMSLGPDAARRLEARVRLETMMETTRAAVMSGSPTTKFLQEVGMAGGSAAGSSAIYGLTTGDWDPKHLSYAGITGAILKAGSGRINLRLAQKVGDLLASNDPEAVRKAAELVSRDPKLMDVIRRADALITRTVNSSSPNLLGNVVPQMIGHADQEKPNGR